MLSLAILWHVAAIRPYKIKAINRLEIVNEAVILIILDFLFCYFNDNYYSKETVSILIESVFYSHFT